jgi:hypothetical protein
MLRFDYMANGQYVYTSLVYHLNVQQVTDYDRKLKLVSGDS